MSDLTSRLYNLFVLNSAEPKFKYSNIKITKNNSILGLNHQSQWFIQLINVKMPTTRGKMSCSAEYWAWKRLIIGNLENRLPRDQTHILHHYRSISKTKSFYFKTYYFLVIYLRPLWNDFKKSNKIHYNKFCATKLLLHLKINFFERYGKISKLPKTNCKEPEKHLRPKGCAKRWCLPFFVFLNDFLVSIFYLKINHFYPFGTP